MLGLQESGYLNGPADCTDGTEDVGCDWNVHTVVSSAPLSFYTEALIPGPVRVTRTVNMTSALGAVRYRGTF